MEGKALLKDKVIVITGGTKGIGREVAIKAAGLGAKVVVGGRSQSDGKEIEDTIGAFAPGAAVFVKADVTDPKQCENLINTAIEKFGTLDGLVNYAGITDVGSLVDTDEKLFDAIFSTNIKGAFFCAKYACKYMKEAHKGSIVNVGSLHAYGGEENMAAYACSKGALRTLTQHIAKDYAKYHIRCNWVTVGSVATPSEIAQRAKEGRDLEWINGVGKRAFPMGRIQTIEDNVPGILYLLSDLADQVSGTELFITGGLMDANFS